MAEESNAPIIIKRVKKRHHDAHHGGAWKVAYADFVTAMMAFFLLLWLLNATTEDQRKGIAEYFSPVPGAVGETTGGNGFFGGQTVTTEGPMVESNAPVSVTIPIPTTSFDQEKTEGTEEQQAAKGKDDQGKEPDASDPDKAQKLLEELENKQFKEAEQQLRQAIQKIPDIKELAENLIIDQTPEGLRIQLVDQDKNSMFPRGGTTMTDKARILMHQVAKVITKLPQKIAISGHTDSTPYANANGYDNWDLSTDRANASRRALIEAGLNPERIVNLAGKAETEPFIKDDPTSPQNRRISIVLLREKAAQNAAGNGAPGTGKDTDESVAAPPKPKT